MNLKGGKKMADLTLIKVEKKDGTQEPFMREKIINGVTRSGGTPEQAESITAQIEGWVTTTALNGVIKTVDIRNKLLELLRGLNPQAAATFEAYIKPAA